MRHTSLLLLAGAIALAAVAFPPSAAPDSPCEHTVTIDSVNYRVPDRWCGRYVPPALWAHPDSLARLPDELSHADSRIYLTRPTRDAFVAMAAAARNAGILLLVDSGYRSPGYQRQIIIRRMAEGKSFDEVMRHVAPPGFSQHHTGRALDLTPSEAAFAGTDAYRWLKANAASFGFEETYPEPRTPEGFSAWESWHWYYEGK